MSSKTFGWQGKILRVDLSHQNITELDTMAYAPLYLGGRGIASRIYWELVTPEVGAFDPENCLIFMTGPLVGTGAQGASRFVVVGKSPMLKPEGFCYGNLGGYFASSLKGAGYDGLVVTGCAERPSSIFINDGKTEIKDAAALWGKSVSQVDDTLKETLGKGVRFITTGVAGENRCRTATLRTDHEGNATGGFGAVMGAKNLKVIAVKGTSRPAVAHPETLRELNRLTVRLSKRGTLRMPLPKEQMQFIRKSPCHQCGLDCLRGLFRTASGREEVRKCQSMAFYLPWVFKRTGENIESALDATGICNELSLCTMEMENITRWCEDCYHAGYLTEAGTGLALSKIGSREFFEKLANMIAHREEGLGDILAEGLLRAGERLGDDAVAHFADDVSGVGLGASYSPREYIINALLYAMDPRQPIAMLHEVSFMIARWLLHGIKPELSITTSAVFRAAATKFWGSDKAWDMTSYEGKALAAVKIQDRTYVKDSLLLCDFVWPIMDSFNTPDHVGDPTLESRLFSAVTGIETDEAGLNEYGERLFNLQRIILLREGWQAKTSDMPAEFNFTHPIQTNPVNPRLIVPGPTEEPASVKGFVLDRKKFEQMREEFYMLRGWDPETGLQKEETLQRLGLADMVPPLKEKGLVA